MNTNLPVNNAGLVLLAINRQLVTTAPNRSINLVDVISVGEGVLSIDGSNVKTLRVTHKGTSTQPDIYDFQLNGEGDATATAGATVGLVTAGDEWLITVDGVPFSYEAQNGDTAGTIKTAMDALLTANTQGFTFSSSNTAGDLLYDFDAPAGSTSSWNGRTVTSTFPTNVGPTFSAAVETDFVGGSGIAEQFQAFLTDQELTAYLPIYTDLIKNNSVQVKNGSSFMLNSRWVVSSTFDGTNTTITYAPPLLLQQAYIVGGDQTAASSTFNV